MNECHVQPCLNNGICIDKVNAFSCNCTSDYSGNTCQNGNYFLANTIVYYDAF